MSAALSLPMREMLWEIAQHKYGWGWADRHGGLLQVADALVRRGLVRFGEYHGRDHPNPRVVATNAGRKKIAELFPISPFILETYDWRAVRASHGEWTPRPSKSVASLNPREGGDRG